MERARFSVIAHNIRSAHNIGAIFRTSDGFGIEHLYLSGYSPYPVVRDDGRLPHIASKVTAEIAKTSLGAEKTVSFSYTPHPAETIARLKADEYQIVGLEQDKLAVSLPDYVPQSKIALILGEELDGIPEELIALCDVLVEIPMFGTKESFNVSVAAGIALYAMRYN